MDVGDCRGLLLHMEWADALVWRAVLGATAPDDSPCAPRITGGRSRRACASAAASRP